MTPTSGHMVSPWYRYHHVYLIVYTIPTLENVCNSTVAITTTHNLADPEETAQDMVYVYRQECMAMRVRPITKLLEQLEVRTHLKLNGRPGSRRFEQGTQVLNHPKLM